jgi:hypothetical protein
MDCKAPTCVYNEKKNKCQKPNAYVQWLSKCRKTINSIQKCKTLYSNSVNKHKKNACDYYLENSKIKNSTCPKSRIPINDKCPTNYPIKKLNKNNDECCYKEKKVIQKIKGIKPAEKQRFPDLEPEKLINGKLPKIVYKYQHRQKRDNKINKY